MNGGVRYNIVPDSTVLEGTIRTFDEGMRSTIHERIKRTAEKIATSAGATATVNDLSVHRRHDQRRRADRADGADAQARRRRGQGRDREADDDGRRLRAVRAESSGDVLLPRDHAEERGRVEGGA